MHTRSATALLKYRFGLLQHMQNHLHMLDGRTLFFYRDPRTTVTGGARVVIEFSFGASEQATSLRGAVLARIEGDSGQSGAWIEFPDTRLARKIGGGGGAEAIEGRRQRRLGCDLMVEIKLGRRQFLGRMVDVSLGGARVVGPAGLRPGSLLEMRVMGAEPPIPGELGTVEVVRSESGGDLGVRFVRSDAVARVASGRLYSAVQQAWARAPEIAHSPLCCKSGHVLEPPLPHMKGRT